MIYLSLFWEFFKTGLFAVGGGMATFPFLADMADRTGWFTQNELANMIAISESTPGPMGVNCATYAGFHVAGVPGGIIATMGLVAPSIIVILVISAFLAAFRSNPVVDKVFHALRPASVALIAAAGFSVAAMALFYEGGGALYTRLNLRACILAAVVLWLSQYFRRTRKVHPVVWIALSAVAGVLFL